MSGLFSFSCRLHFAAAICFLAARLPSVEAAIVFGQVDTFQNGTTQNWSEGASSPNPPTNVPNGGPMGAGDAYLEDASSGGFGAGSKLIMFNQVQWSGNYNAAGVDRITAQMANFGQTTLNMRVALKSSAGTTYGSSTAFVLPPDGTWRAVTFNLSPAAMTNIGGPETLAQVLERVAEVRILSAIGGPSAAGDPVLALLGVDNITATSSAGPAPLALTNAVSRRSHGGTPFDVALPLTGSAGIEPRASNPPGSHTVIFTFNRDVTSGSASITTGTGTAGTATFSGSTMTVPLSGVTNAQQITLTLNGVSDGAQTLPATAVNMAVLAGDVTGDGFVNSGDATVTRNRSGLPVDNTTFRADVNADGSINSGDATIVRNNSGNGL